MSGQVAARDDAAPYDALTSDGRVVRIRPVQRGDRGALNRLVDGLSERSSQQRFLGHGPAHPHEYVEHLLALDAGTTAVVALVGSELVGVASVHAGAGTDAEVGLLVADAHQGRGIGTLLLEDVADRARRHGLSSLMAWVSADNARMLHAFRTAGYEVVLHSYGALVRLRCSLDVSRRAADAIAERNHAAEVASLSRLFCPRGVAVVGAGADPAGFGHQIVGSLLRGNFRGTVQIVNRSGRPVCGITPRPSVSALTCPVDLAVIAVPAAAVLEVARDCAAIGVGGIVVVSGGFAESGPKGAARQAELLAVCRRAGMRLIGPNCLGIVNTAPEASLNASFLPRAPCGGEVAVMTQSGAVGAALVDELDRRGIGVAMFASVGNKADVSGNDLLEMWRDDPRAKVIALHLESVGNPVAFARIGARVSRSRPVVAVKSGRTPGGARAVRSHTAAAATPDAAVDALFARAGVVRVGSLRELADVSLLLARQPLPGGPRLAVVGNSGGPEVLAADACAAAGVQLATFTPGTERRIRNAVSKQAASTTNPVDLAAGATAEQLEHAIVAVAGDPGVDAVLAVTTPLAHLPVADVVAALRGAAAAMAGKPLLVSVLGVSDTTASPVPAFEFPEDAVQALGHAVRYAAWRERVSASRPPAPRSSPPVAEDIVAGALRGSPRGRWLAGQEVDRLLRAAGIETVASARAGNPDAAAAAAVSLGFPVVLKAELPGVVHKSDVGGVAVGLGTSDEVRAVYRRMRAKFGTGMTAGVIQPVVSGVAALIVGAVNDASFGPLVMVGSGGVLTDLVADRAWALAPLSPEEADDILARLRCAPLLHGFRGRPPAQLDRLRDTVLAVADLVDSIPSIAELDLNPVLVSERAAVVVDARVRVAPPTRTVGPDVVRRMRSAN